MRVVIVVEQLRRAVPGGIGTYARGLLQGLGHLADPPEVVLHASRAAARPDPVLELGYPLRAVPLPGPMLTRAWDRGWLPAPPGDVVHGTSLAMPPTPNAHASVMVHGLEWRETPDAFPARARRWHEAAYARALRRCEVIIVPSKSVGDAVAVDATSARVEVVEEGSDHLPPGDEAGADRVLAATGVAGPFVLTVGTLEPRKNLARLIAAYEIARPALPEPWPLLIAGPPGWGDVAPVGGVGVHFVGRVPDAALAALLGRARCVIYVPLHEGFGLPALEAMAAGAPVVASPMPSTGGAAIEVDPLDPEAIADGIVRASSDAAVASELVAAGRARADGLTWEATARRHVELWRSML